MILLSAEKDNLLEKCICFIRSTGIPVIKRETSPDDFLPGLSIQEGAIIVNEKTLKYPGDILHEAGHIAVVPAAERSNLNATAISMRPNREAEEMMAIAWSYAACLHLAIDPHFVFHDDGYKGGGSNIVENFSNQHYFGLPMLQWVGMAADEKNAAAMNIAPYPAMIKWLRD